MKRHLIGFAIVSAINILVYKFAGFEFFVVLALTAIWWEMK